MINRLTRKCGHIVPNRIQTRTCDFFGSHNTGPNIYSTQPWFGLETYYYLEDSTAGVLSEKFQERGFKKYFINFEIKLESSDYIFISTSQPPPFVQDIETLT